MSENENQQANEEIQVQVKGASVIKPGVPETLKTSRDPEAFKESFSKVGRINVKPFIDQTIENMGLENYGMTLFPGTFHEEQLAAIERNGQVRFITGLDEFAPEVQNIADKEQKASVIFNIRSVVANLEQQLATNVLDVEDPQFWNKVKLLQPTNIQFWSGITIRCGNDPLTLEPAKDPYDLIKFMAIEAGGFDLVAKSYDDGLARPVAPKFFLDKEVNTVSSKATYKRLRNKATSILDKIANKQIKKLLYITKVIDSNSASYSNSTPTDILYDALDDYIGGEGAEPNKKKAAEHFITVAQLDMETLKLRAIVKDASFYRFIVPKPDGQLYHASSNVMLGRNVSDVVLYLKNPVNEDVLTNIMGEVEKYWNN